MSLAIGRFPPTLVRGLPFHRTLPCCSRPLLPILIVLDRCNVKKRMILAIDFAFAITTNFHIEAETACILPGLSLQSVKSLGQIGRKLLMCADVPPPLKFGTCRTTNTYRSDLALNPTSIEPLSTHSSYPKCSPVVLTQCGQLEHDSLVKRAVMTCARQPEQEDADLRRWCF